MAQPMGEATKRCSKCRLEKPIRWRKRGDRRVPNSICADCHNQHIRNRRRSDRGLSLDAVLAREVTPPVILAQRVCTVCRAELPGDKFDMYRLRSGNIAQLAACHACVNRRKRDLERKRKAEGREPEPNYVCRACGTERVGKNGGRCHPCAMNEFRTNVAETRPARRDAEDRERSRAQARKDEVEQVRRARMARIKHDITRYFAPVPGEPWLLLGTCGVCKKRIMDNYSGRHYTCATNRPRTIFRADEKAPA